MKHLIEVGVLGGLLAATLVGTYLIHNDEGASSRAPAEGVAVYNATVADLSKVTFDSKQATIRIERRTDDRGEHLWIDATTRVEKTPPPPPPPEIDPDDPDAEPPPPPPPPEPVIEEKTQRFVGNEQAERIWESFAPFRASRTLDVTGADIDLGFDDPQATLTVERRGGTVEMVIGNATFGDRSRYLKSGDRVFLVEKRSLTRLEGSVSTLAERRLHPLDPGQVAAIAVARGDQQQRFVQRNADDRARAYWARAETPDTSDKTAGGWLASASRLSALEYLEARPEGAQPVVSFVFEARTGEKWPVELLKVDGEPSEFFVDGVFNRSVVSIAASQAEDLLVDLDAIFVPAESAAD